MGTTSQFEERYPELERKLAKRQTAAPPTPQERVSTAATKTSEVPKESQKNTHYQRKMTTNRLRIMTRAKNTSEVCVQCRKSKGEGSGSSAAANTRSSSKLAGQRINRGIAAQDLGSSAKKRMKEEETGNEIKERVRRTTNSRPSWNEEESLTRRIKNNCETSAKR